MRHVNETRSLNYKPVPSDYVSEMKRDGFALWCFIAYTVVCFLPIAASQDSINAFCSQFLPKDYKIYMPPQNAGKPAEVFVAFQVLDVGEISEETLDFRLHTFIVTIWNDSRLLLASFRGKSALIYPQCRKYMWTPDIFFESAKQVEMFEDTSPSTFVKVLDDGALCMSSRYSFKASCNMNLKNYPFDIQRCQFLLAFMSSSDNVAKLRWTGEPNSPYKDLFPSINIVRDSQPLKFYLKAPSVSSVTEDFTTGNYTSLIAIFSLVRRLTGSVINTYAPSTMIVTMSWVGFWLNVEAVPARVALSVTSLLTLCTQADQYKSQMPAVNYIKAMDIWLFVCIIMVFATLLEFAVAYNLHYRKCLQCQIKFNKVYMDGGKDDKENGTCFVQRPKINPWQNENKKKIKFILTTVKKSELNNNKSGDNIITCDTCQSYLRLGLKIDTVSRKIFPGFFLIFALIYWVYYLRMYNENA